MANDFYEYNDDLIPGSTARSGNIDTQLAAIETAMEQIQDHLYRAIRFTDGSTPAAAFFQLSANAASRANKVLGFDANGDVSIVADVGSWDGDWATSTAYSVKSVVRGPSSHNNSIYICQTAHTSSDFATDLAAGRWALMIDLTTVKQTIITHQIVGNGDSPVALSAGQDVMVDVSAGSVTLQLPASPSITDQPINIMHIDGELGVDGTLTIDRNGKPIMGLAENMTVDVENASFGLAYCDATRGWRVRGV